MVLKLLFLHTFFSIRIFLFSSPSFTSSFFIFFILFIIRKFFFLIMLNFEKIHCKNSSFLVDDIRLDRAKTIKVVGEDDTINGL